MQRRTKSQLDRPFDAVRGRGAQFRGALAPEHERLGFAPLRCRTLADMTEDEIRALERYYGCPVIRPKKRRRRAPESNRTLDERTA